MTLLTSSKQLEHDATDAERTTRLTSCTEMRHDSAHHATDAEQLQDATDR